MQIVENWTDIKGQVLGQTPSEQLPGFCEVAIDVEQASDVPGFRNLLSDTERTTLVVHFPKELTDELNIREGTGIVCRVRKASLQRSFVHRQHVTLI